MADANSWRFTCCNRVQNAAREARRPTVMVLIKPARRRVLKPYYTVTVTEEDGRLLASCRHELVDHGWATRANELVTLIYNAVGL